MVARSKSGHHNRQSACHQVGAVRSAKLLCLYDYVSEPAPESKESDEVLATDRTRLVFMTYNGWVMIAVSFGAGLGYLLFGARTTATKDTACH